MCILYVTVYKPSLEKLDLCVVSLTTMDFLIFCIEPTATDVCITLEADSH